MWSEAVVRAAREKALGDLTELKLRAGAAVTFGQPHNRAGIDRQVTFLEGVLAGLDWMLEGNTATEDTAHLTEAAIRNLPDARTDPRYRSE